MQVDEMRRRQKPRRKVQGISAALLPFEADRRVAVAAFQKHLVATQRAGLANAVNMDTGYVNYLSDSEKEDVLRWTREALGKDVAFVAGAYIEGLEGETVTLYRRQIDSIATFGASPILFQTARLKGKPGAELAAVYRAVCR